MDAVHELAVLGKMADELQAYLLSDVAFWQMQAGSHFPKLSLGRLLLARTRLRALEPLLSPAQRTTLQKAEQQVENVLGQWAVAAEKHAADELRTRTNLWQRFWDDCADAPGQCVDQYAQEVSQRAIAGLLLREFPRVAGTPEARVLEALDASIRPRLRPADFVWEAVLEPGFPPEAFWFLYGQPYGARAAR